ncbi:DUF2865 domain-containing protein [Tepidamorphus sp. 3E244]|uniref:DUF2865 domain-containing protein n=1 Tax=Tepidamorphus sp. 3E244 TaxID=3385498 RepID=UPI0038FCECC3
MARAALRAAGIVATCAALVVFVIQPALAQSSEVCRQLESELARMQGTQPSRSNVSAAQLERARRAARQAESRASRAGCFERGFLIFQPQKPRACRQLEAEYRSANDAYRNLAAQAGNGRGRPTASRGQRDRVIRALAANGCGAQYARYANSNRRNVFSFFLGPQSYVDEPMAPRGGGYRTLCVRKCDGYYFPISFSTIPSYFDNDEQTCRRLCPGAEVGLFVYRNPGETPENARTPQGVALTEMENAFRYRNEVVDDCSCRTEEVAGATGEASRARMTFSPGLVSEDKQITEFDTPPMPRQKPSRYAVSDIENPSVPVGIESTPQLSSAENAVQSSATANRRVRVVGPQYYYSR